MRYLAIPLLVTLASASLAQNSIDGRWSVRSRGMPANAKVLVSLARGKMSMTMTGPQAGRTVKIEASGTYSLKGAALTSKVTDAKMDPAGLSAADRKKYLTPENRARFKQMMTRRPGPSGTIRFLGKDKFELKGKDGRVTTFSRVR